MGLFDNIFFNTRKEVLEFADFTSDDIKDFNLLENATFTPFSIWTGQEGEFRTAPLGANERKYASLSGTHKGLPVHFFIAEKIVQRNKSSSYEHDFFMDVEIPFYTPHVIVIPSVSTLLAQVAARNAVRVDFGKFNDYYEVLAAKNQESKAFELLPPDTLLQLIEKIPNATITYHKNIIRIQFNIETTGLTMGRNILGVIKQEDFINHFNAVLELIPEIVDSAYTGRITPEEFVELKGFSNNFSKFMSLYGLMILLLWGFFYSFRGQMTIANFLLDALLLFVISTLSAIVIVTFTIKKMTRNISMNREGFGKKD